MQNQNLNVYDDFKHLFIIGVFIDNLISKVPKLEKINLFRVGTWVKVKPITGTCFI